MRYSTLDVQGTPSRRSGRLERLGRAVLAALAMSGGAVAWAATTRGPDAGGYTGTDATTYSFVDISGAGGGTSILAGADDSTTVLALPFPFRFYGQQYSLVCVSSNGALYFVANNAACDGLVDFANVDLSAVAPPRDPAAVMPFWSDLTFEAPGAGSVFYQTVGAAPNRRVIVQWNNAFPQGSPNPVTFQAILSENGNTVLFQYKTVTLGAGNPANNGAQATIGVRNAGALTNQQQIAWSFGAPVVADSTALLFTAQVQGKVDGDVNGDGVVNCSDVEAVTAAIGRRRGHPAYSAAADLNNDGIINGVDLNLVMWRLPAQTQCPGPRGR
jgi:hypothetical protein